MSGTSDITIAVQNYIDKVMDRFIRSESMEKIFVKAAIGLLQVAFDNATNENSVSHNLTGNLKFGYAIAIFAKGELTNVVTYEGIKWGHRRPLVGMVEVGDGSNNGMRYFDYDSGEEVEFTMNYNDPNLTWQPTKRGVFAYDIAKRMVKAYKVPKVYQKGVYMVLVNGAPYAEYLQDVRHLDIITSALLYTQNDLRAILLSNLKKVKLNYYKPKKG